MNGSGFAVMLDGAGLLELATLDGAVAFDARLVNVEAGIPSRFDFSRL